MKSLWKVLTGEAKASPGDLADAIVEMEDKIVGAKKEVEDIERAALQLQQMKLSGEEVHEDAIELSERKVSTAQRNLKAAEMTLGELHEKLKEAVTQKIQDDNAAFEIERGIIREKWQRAREKFIKEFARLKALQIGLDGPEAKFSTISCDALNDEEKVLLKEEMASQLLSQQKPTVWEDYRRLENLTNIYKSRTHDSIIADLLAERQNRGSLN